MKIIPDIPKERTSKGFPIFKPFGQKTKTVEVVKDDEPLQLDLGLKQSPLNKLFEVRQKLDKLEDRVRLSQYWSNPLIWMSLIFPLFMFFIFFKFYISVYNLIPDQVPLVKINKDFSEIFLPKYWMILIPSLITFFSLATTISFRIAYRKLEKFVFINFLFFLTLTIIAYYIVWSVSKIFA